MKYTSIFLLILIGTLTFFSSYSYDDHSNTLKKNTYYEQKTLFVKQEKNKIKAHTLPPYATLEVNLLKEEIEKIKADTQRKSNENQVITWFAITFVLLFAIVLWSRSFVIFKEMSQLPS